MKRTSRKQCIRWARYFNRYAHIPDVVMGGWAPVRAMNYPGRTWRMIRRQQAHPPGRGYQIGDYR